MRRETPTSSRRFLIIALTAIVVPALLLLFLGLQSLQRQRDAIASLKITNLRLVGERVAAEIERRVVNLADTSLHDPRLEQVVDAASVARTPAAYRALRGDLTALRAAHAIADQFFLLLDGEVRLPMIRAYPYRTLADYLSDESRAVAARFEELFEDAEELELRRDRPDLALERYRLGRDLGVSESLQALALARMARCLRKLRQRDAARAIYVQLHDRFADRYDLASRPYGVVVALELDELRRDPAASAAGRPDDARLRALTEDLVNGRWELSTDEADYFLSHLGARERFAPATTDYLRRLDVAHSLQADFNHTGPMRQDELYSSRLATGAGPSTLFYRSVSHDDDRNGIVGLVVDQEALRRQAEEIATTMRLDAAIAIADQPLAGTDDREGDVIRVAFTRRLPGWELQVAMPKGASSGTASRETLVFAGSTLTVLAVLGFGVFLVIRDASRDRQVARLRADFVSGVSHELRTPLTLIRLYAETLLHGKALPTEQRTSFYQIITRESERLTHLIEKVLDFASIDRGERSYRFVNDTLFPVVSRTVEGYRQYLERRGFTIDATLEENLPPVRFDPDAVSQAIVNLIDNAVKYSGASRYLGIALRRDEAEVTFEVADHGVGIPTAEIDKIFGQFYRGQDRSGKGGYGLGLFLVKHIMDAHGGRIDVESEVGGGSTFRLVFPVQEESTES